MSDAVIDRHVEHYDFELLKYLALLRHDSMRHIYDGWSMASAMVGG